MSIRLLGDVSGGAVLIFRWLREYKFVWWISHYGPVTFILHANLRHDFISVLQKHAVKHVEAK